ncbi:MAG: PhoPQ-activated pathogenicity-related family protein [Candidatus Hydrogenedentes bacterium]|nr:PhoPQ-activated pathogenicity-related family protein [Candidatus Hydrogenedentota bacterium]
MRHGVILGVVLLAVMFALSPAHANYLTTTKLGEGSVSPSVGSHWYVWYTKVNVSATPAPGWVFDHWEGSFAGQPASFSFRSTSDKWACAVFRPVTPSSATALVQYVGATDAATSYVINDIDGHTGWDGYEMTLTSQNWRSTAEVDRTLWQHDMVMARPWFHGDEVLYLINGGSYPLKHPSPDGTIAAAAIALGSIYAQIDQVPNQPLYFADEVNNARTEDEVLAYSLDKVLTTGDWTWAAHAAMVKAAVKGMNFIQKEVKTADKFIVVGASKRGWTTWLTAAVDPRVACVVPLVIDVFQLHKQVEHHWEAYGSYSPAIQDYVDFDLFCRAANDPLAPDLQNIVDPYRFISKFTMPALIINGSSDQFFLPDSSRFYLDELPNQADMRLRYFPNKDHYMEGVIDDYDNIYQIFSWGFNQVYGYDNPYIDWTVDGNGAITVTTSKTPDSVKLWQATNPTARDFRLETVGAIYTSSDLPQQGNGTYIGYCPPPAQGWTAYFVEADLGAQVFTTRIYVTPDIDPFDGLGCWE